MPLWIHIQQTVVTSLICHICSHKLAKTQKMHFFDLCQINISTGSLYSRHKCDPGKGESRMAHWETVFSIHFVSLKNQNSGSQLVANPLYFSSVRVNSYTLRWIIHHCRWGQGRGCLTPAMCRSLLSSKRQNIYKSGCNNKFVAFIMFYILMSIRLIQSQRTGVNFYSFLPIPNLLSDFPLFNVESISMMMPCLWILYGLTCIG